ncbi:MAG: hypothetical protein ABH828_03800 [archaeon]
MNQLLITRHFKSPKLKGVSDMERGIPDSEKIKAKVFGEELIETYNLTDIIGIETGMTRARESVEAMLGDKAKRIDTLHFTAVYPAEYIPSTGKSYDGPGGDISCVAEQMLKGNDPETYTELARNTAYGFLGIFGHVMRDIAINSKNNFVFSGHGDSEKTHLIELALVMGGKKQDKILNLVKDLGGSPKGSLSCRYVFAETEPTLYLGDETITLGNTLSTLPRQYDVEKHFEAQKTSM